MKRTAAEMYQFLEAAYAPPPSKPPGGRLLKEIQAPHSTRRADALYLPITTGHRGTIIGHEIKVSRSDVIAELRDPHKADSWLRYCTKWWLVIGDPSLIDGLDIPEEWGIMAPPTKNRFMTTIRPAPKLTPQPGFMQEAWGTIFARVAYADIAVERQAVYTESRNVELTRANQELQQENRRLSSIVNGGKTSQSRIAIADVLTAIEKLGGYGEGTADGLQGMAWNVDAERIARWVLTEARLEKPRDLSEDIRIVLSQTERAAATLRSLLDGLANPG